MNKPIQGELFRVNPYGHLFGFWRSNLSKWPAEVLYWRHALTATGWGMARMGFSYAVLLFSQGQLTLAEFRRWALFNRRVRRWDRARSPYTFPGRK